MPRAQAERLSLGLEALHAPMLDPPPQEGKGTTRSEYTSAPGEQNARVRNRLLLSPCLPHPSPPSNISLALREQLSQEEVDQQVGRPQIF